MEVGKTIDKLNAYGDVKFETRDIPLYINMLMRLESTRLTGRYSPSANKELELAWAKELSLRLNKCLEKPTPCDMYLICHYIASIQYEDFKVKLMGAKLKEHIADIIKDYLLTHDELKTYKDYTLRIEKNS